MSASIIPGSGNALESANPHRAELEDQLFKAIERARRQYILANEPVESPPRPQVNPPHLGLKVDVRA